MQHSVPLQMLSSGCKSVSQAVMAHNGVTETFLLPRTFQFCSHAVEHLFQIHLEQHKGDSKLNAAISLLLPKDK